MDRKRFDYAGWYAGHISNSFTWRRHADELLAAADLIEPAIRAHWDWARAHAAGEKKPYPGPSLQKIHFLLYAYAIENILKARLVTALSWEVREEAQETGRLPDFLKGHDLVKLAKMAGIQVTVEEEALLQRLTRHAVWMGRYPAPLRADQLRAKPLSDGQLEGGNYFFGSDVDSLRDLVRLARD